MAGFLINACYVVAGVLVGLGLARLTQVLYLRRVRELEDDRNRWRDLANEACDSNAELTLLVISQRDQLAGRRPPMGGN